MSRDKPIDLCSLCPEGEERRTLGDHAYCLYCLIEKVDEDHFKARRAGNNCEACRAMPPSTYNDNRVVTECFLDSGGGDKRLRRWVSTREARGYAVGDDSRSSSFSDSQDESSAQGESNEPRSRSPSVHSPGTDGDNPGRPPLNQGDMSGKDLATLDLAGSQPSSRSHLQPSDREVTDREGRHRDLAGSQ